MVTYQNLEGACAPTTITSVSVATSCMPTPQPKYLAYKIDTGYFLSDAEDSPFYSNETLSASCFSLVTATPTSTYPLYDVSLGHIPYVKVTYTATEFSITPASNPLQVITTVSGTFAITGAEALTTTDVLSLVSISDSLIFTAVTLSGDCVVSGTPTPTQLLFTSTKTISQGVSTLLMCTVTGMTVAFANSASRVVADDPYVLLRTAVVLRSPSNPTVGAALATNIVLRITSTPAFYYHWASTDRVLVQGATMATRLLKLSLALYAYPTTPTTAVAFNFVTSVLTAVCPGLTISAGTGAVSFTAGQRSNTYTATFVEFDVTAASYYPFDTAKCFGFSSATGTLAKAGTSIVALDQAITHDLDFAWYPVTANLASIVDPAEATHATAPIDVTWEVVIFPHKALSADWGINFTAQATIAPALVFNSGIVTKPSMSSYTALSCTVTANSATELCLSGCDAVTSAGNLFFVPRVIRFGPVRTTYANYNDLFMTYSASTGMTGMNVASVVIPQQNTNVDVQTIENSPPAVVISHQITTITSATVSNATEPPTVLAMTDQTYLFKIFFFRPVLLLTASYAYALSTQVVDAPTISETCSNTVSGKVTDCLLEERCFTSFLAKFSVPYEFNAFATTDFTFTLDTSYMFGGLITEVANAFLDQPLTNPLSTSVLPFAYHIVLAAHSWAMTDLTTALHIFVFPLRSPVAEFTLSLGSDCGVYTSGLPVNLLNQDSGTCTTRYSGGFTTMSVPASCMPTPQPKYIGFRIADAYFLEHVNESAFKDTLTIPKSCFNLTSTEAPVTTYHPLQDVKLGSIPPPNVFMYGATLTRDSTATQHRARLDIRAVLTNVIPTVTIDVKVTLSAKSTTCPVSPKSSFVNSVFHPGTSGCLLASVTATVLTVTCTDGPFEPSYPIAFGFSHLELDPTKLVTFDSPAYVAPDCIIVQLIFEASTTSGAPLYPVGAPPPLQATVDRTRTTDVFTAAPFHLQVTFFDMFWYTGMPSFDFVLPTTGDFTFYDYPADIPLTTAGFTAIKIPSSSFAVTVTTEVTAAVPACSSTAGCVLRFPLERRFTSGPANPMQSLTILSRTMTEPAQIVTLVPIAVLPDALEPQQAPTPPLSIFSALFAVSGTNERALSIVLFSTQTAMAHLDMNFVLTLPLTGISYGSAQYSVLVETGSASAPVAVGATGVIVIPYVASMINMKVTVDVKQVAVSALSDRLVVIAELMGSRTTSAAMTLYEHKLMNIGYGAVAVAVTTAFAYATKQMILSDTPAHSVATSCTHSVGTTRYMITCDMTWTSINDVAADMELALVTRDALPHNTPIDVVLESVQRLLPTPISLLCKPLTAGANVPLTSCFAAGTSSTTLRVTVSCSHLIIEQQLELRLMSSTALRAIAVIPAFAAGAYPTSITDVTHSLTPEKNYGPLRAVINVPYWSPAVSATQRLEIKLQGASATVRFVATTPPTMTVEASLTDSSSNRCDLVCIATESSLPDVLRAINCPIFSCGTLSGDLLTLTIENTEIGTSTSERAEVEMTILNDKSQQLYTGRFDVIRGSISSYFNAATTTDLVHTLIAPTDMCAGGNVMINSDEYMVLTFPPSMQTGAVLAAFSAAAIKMTVPLTAGGTNTLTLTMVPLSPLRSLKLTLASPSQYYCLQSVSAVLVITFPAPASYRAGEVYTLDIVSPNSLVRYRHFAELQVMSSATMVVAPTLVPTLHSASGRSYLTLETTLDTVPNELLSEALIEVTFGP